MTTYALRQGNPAFPVKQTLDNLCTASTFGEALNCSSGGLLAGFGSASPSTAAQGDSALFTAAVSGGMSPYAVTIDLSSLGGSATQDMFDDGPGGGHGDAVAGDNVFSFRHTIPCGQTVSPPTYLLDLTVTDNTPTTIHPQIGLTVVSGQPAATGTPPLPTDRTVCLGSRTFFTVTASGGNRVYQWFNLNGLVSDGGAFSARPRIS